MNKIRRIFNPTPQERLEDLLKIKSLLKKNSCERCSNCALYILPGTNIPEYYGDYGSCQKYPELFNYYGKCEHWQNDDEIKKN